MTAPLGYCPHCNGPVIGQHHDMYRCRDAACARWWNAREIIAAEDFDAGVRADTPAPIINEPVTGLEDAPVCGICGQRQAVCCCARRPLNDGEPTDFTEVDR